MTARENQVTQGPGGRILTNIGVWSPDGQWIVYDTRSDPSGSAFDGERIERVHAETGEVQVLYTSRNHARCGVATWNPRTDKVVFILGPENPTPDWEYSFSHRQGVVVDLAAPGKARNLEPCDLTPPFTPGALRGGTHVHVWDPSGEWVAFTYNDALAETQLRDIGICTPAPGIRVSRRHPRNHDGDFAATIVTRTVAQPRPGSDDIQRACEEGWVGVHGYTRADGTRQTRALAFQGTVLSPVGDPVIEVFVVDLPAVLPPSAPAPALQERPAPPPGVSQRRLTFTANRRFPGIQGPRHWLRTSPDGSRIAFLMKDDEGIAQIWTVSPNGGPPVQITRNPHPVASAFSWSPDGRWIAHAMDHSICVTLVSNGATQRLTPPTPDASTPRPEACVFSPDGRRIAFVRPRSSPATLANQICVLTLSAPLP